jgi:aspartate kinase
MKVYKFGGASVNSIERIRNLGDILEKEAPGPVMVIVSAMGKTTNALEKVAEAFYQGDQETSIRLFHETRDSHLQTARALLEEKAGEASGLLESFFTEVEWLLHDKPVRPYDYYYDQVVCTGELLSTAILSAYLNHRGIPNQWLDVRDIMRTDDNFRDATIDWEHTRSQVDTQVKPLFATTRFVVTQGFIGATDENESTTLGREGSDYTAAVFANLLDAENLTIWKDVEAVMNADPRLVPDAQRMPELNYDEVIEMAYYGAQVIHPKTIKPLQNKGIPLRVKCFLDPSLPGTLIHNHPLKGLPPIIVWKASQALLTLHSTDFSFVGEKPVAMLYHWLSEIKLKPNLIQTGAVTVELCLDDHPEKIRKLAEKASELFEVHVESGLSLLTVRHYRDEIIQRELRGRKPVLQQATEDTVQALVRGDRLATGTA